MLQLLTFSYFYKTQISENEAKTLLFRSNRVLLLLIYEKKYIIDTKRQRIYNVKKQRKEV